MLPPTEPKREKALDNNERRYENLKNALLEISGRLNVKFKAEMGGGKVGDLVDGECRLREEAFVQGRRRGPYPEEKVREDKKRLTDKEVCEFAPDFSNEKVRKFYEDRGASDTEEMLKLFQEDQAISNWHQLEMATTVLFHKFLPDNFVAVKAAKYDDYENGVDSLIVNKSTGEVVCTIDDFSGSSGGERERAKQKKALAKAKKGGARVRYGFTYDEDGTLRKTSLEKIPTFNLRLSSDAVRELLDGMNFELGQPSSEKERSVMLKVIDDLLKQTEVMVQSGLDIDMKSKILKFRQVAENWRSGI